MPDAGTKELKKTQIGPGSKSAGIDMGSCGEMGETDLPAFQNTARLGEEATQPCGFSKGQRAWKLQPNRVTVAPQA